jgi:hypothetical protein
MRLTLELAFLGSLTHGRKWGGGEPLADILVGESAQAMIATHHALE